MGEPFVFQLQLRREIVCATTVPLHMHLLLNQSQLLVLPLELLPQLSQHMGDVALLVGHG